MFLFMHMLEGRVHVLGWSTVIGCTAEPAPSPKSNAN